MLETAINWFASRQGKVTYSMTNRLGPSSYDCSSAVYLALKSAGLLPASIGIGNTDSLFGDLERNGWVQVPVDANGNAACQRGDVFIWGKRGASGGASGHTGMFIDANNIIHCAYGYNGIHVDNHDWLWAYNNSPAYTFYRYVGTPAPTPPPASSTTIKFDRIYNVDQLAQVNGIWQVRTNALAPTGFNWDDNGIPAAPLVQVDEDGYRTADQDFVTTKLYKLPGKFTVKDAAWDQGVYWYLVNVGGYDIWVDSAAVARIGANDAGTPSPASRPVATQPPQTQPPATPAPTKPPETPAPTQPPATTPPATNPPQTTPPATQPPETSAPIETNQPKENKPVAISKEQQEELRIATEKVLAANDAFEPIISERTKTVAYFATDVFAAGSTFILTVLAIVGVVGGDVAIYIAAACNALALALKGTFRLSSKKQ